MTWAPRAHVTTILINEGPSTQLSQLIMNQNEFKRLIWDYYRKHGRDMPWRRTQDPYAIFVSEVMLQQTQVSRVLVNNPQFLAEFPDFATLAHTPVSAVLTAWQGMGYNRRALWLKRAAEAVVHDYGGQLPSDVHELIKLPGVGANTAGSIAAFAFNVPTVFIETNIRRVFIHHYLSNESPSTSPGKKISDSQILPLIEKTLDQDNPRQWYYALMDYGSELSKSVPNPNRRSRHYMVQSKFEGSHRQKRAQILKVLIDGPMPFNRLSDELKLPKTVIESIIEELIKEGFIQSKSGIYSLVS